MYMKKFFAFLFIFAFGAEIFAAGRISEQRQKLIDYALSLQGVKYLYAGYEDPKKGFDCSGFIFYTARNFKDPSGTSHQLPRTAKAMYSKCQKIDSKEKEPGDLIFFANSSGVINHVGIYGGIYHNSKNPNTKFEGKRVFISCISDGPRTGVVLELLDAKYWKNHFYGYARFLPKTSEYNQKYPPKK